MSYIDIILAIPMVWGIYSGFRKGIILEAGSFAALVAGFYGALKFSDMAGDYISTKMNISTSYLYLISFILVFILAVVLVFLIAKTIETMFKLAALGWLNQIIGSVFGLIKYSFLISVILLTVQNTGILTTVSDPQPLRESHLFQPLQKLAPAVVTAFSKGAPAKVIQHFDEKKREFFS